MIADAINLPHAFADVTLDSQLQQDAILKKLDELERIADRKGSAIGVASASMKASMRSSSGSARRRAVASRSSVFRPLPATATSNEGRISMSGKNGKPVKAEDLPYRPCVGVMVLNRAGLVWAGRRIIDANSEYDGSPQLWQMPQGGIDKGEDPLPAAYRELYEETGMKTVSLIAERRNGSITTCRNT